MLYVGGSWQESSELDDQLDNALLKSASGLSATALSRMGFARWSAVGNEDVQSCPIALTIHRRDEGPKFAIEVDGSLDDRTEVVWVQGVEDLMDLLARWAPAVMSASRLWHDNRP